jgi:hypothetical protein
MRKGIDDDGDDDEDANATTATTVRNHFSDELCYSIMFTDLNEDSGICNR